MGVELSLREMSIITDILGEVKVNPERNQRQWRWAGTTRGNVLMEVWRLMRVGLEFFFFSGDML